MNTNWKTLPLFRGLFIMLLLFAFSSEVKAQQPIVKFPNCVINFTFTTAPDNQQLDNRQSGCTSWTVTYSATGFSALSFVFQSAPDNNGAPGTWVTFAGTVVTGSNPSTATTQAGLVVTGYYPWVRARLASATGTGSVKGTAQSYADSAQFGGISPTGAAGGCLSGTYPNPGIANITTAGGVVFGNSTPCLAQDASNFFWDNTNKRLGMGTNLPATSLEILNAQPLARFNRAGVYSWEFGVDNGTFSGTSDFAIRDVTSNAVRLTIKPSNGNVLIGSITNRNYRFYVAASGSTGTESVVDTTATTGFTLVDFGWDGTNTSATSTRVRVRAGASQGGTNLMEWQNNAGSVLARIDASGTLSSVGVVSSSVVRVPSTSAFIWDTRGSLNAAADGVLTAYNAAGTDFGRFQLGGITNLFPAIKRSGAGIEFRLADDSAFTTVQASNYISNDGSPGVTGATCTAWKNGLCVTL